MIRRLFRRVFKLAVMIGAAAALYKVVQARKPSPVLPDTGGAWKPVPGAPPASSKPVTSSAAKAPAEPPAKAPVASPAAAPDKVPAKAPVTKPKAATKKATAMTAWVEPEGSTCPTTHPVKGKLASLIYHLPGMLAYERTKPDRCYRDAEAAEADGFRKAKR